MLSPDYLEHVPDRLVELYAQAETDIIADMARKINAYDYFSSASEWQAVKIHEMGLTYEEILKKLSSLSGRTLSELKKLLEEAGVKTLSADDAIYRKAGLSPQPLKESKHLIAILNESLKKTNNTFKNLTSTTAKEASGQFVEALDRAYMQIVTGGIDKNSAVRSAIQHLTENGLRSIKYPTRTDHLDVAVRRAVRTGVNQTAGRLQEARAEEMGCDLVETTAHDGARPSHETWQGKVFSRSGSSKKYPPFKESTGYGTVTGLMGANCRHSFYPFFEDSEPIYTKSELAELNQPKYHYRGKDITEYEAVQRQRYHERQIRRWKREKEAMKAAGQPTDRAEARLRKWNRIQDDFLEQTGLKRQVDLEQIAKKVEKQAANSNWWGWDDPFTVKEGATFKVTLSNVSADVNEKVSAACRKVVENGSKDLKEHLLLLDVKTGKLLYEETGEMQSVGGEAYQAFLKKNTDGKYIFIHNHHNGLFFSLQDVRSFLKTEQINTMIAAGNNGKIFIARNKSENALSIDTYKILREIDENLLKELRKQLRDGKIEWLEYKYAEEAAQAKYLLEKYAVCEEVET